LGLSASTLPYLFQLNVLDGGSFAMQCPSCRAVYSNGLDICPRCKTPALKSTPETDIESLIISQESVMSQAGGTITEEINDTPTRTVQASSTLLEFPGVSRASRPQWRKELSERVREIQERRSRDATAPPEEEVQNLIEQSAAGTAAPQLGLVPQQDAPAINPIVVAALKRLERARQSSPQMSRVRTSMGGAAAAAIARVSEEQYQTEASPTVAQAPVPVAMPTLAPSEQPDAEQATHQKSIETAREHLLTVVPTQPVAKVAVPVSQPQKKRSNPEVEDEAQIAHSEDSLPEAVASDDFYDDRAPIFSRIAGSAIDLLVVAFASSPFAAIIELTNGNWSDWRVIASMCGIVLIVMFLYLTASTALAGRTWGMSLISLRAVDADTGLPPTTRQSVGRAVLYIASLITLGLGILYALFDAEGRTVHDHLSGTTVVRE
jgi:uncharacterized RDD family membrane protein YckC